MKRVILTAAIGIVSILVAEKSNAQFSLQKDTVKAAVANSVILSNDLTNLAGGTVTVSWKVIYHNLPVSWQPVVGLCDNVSCYANNILGTSSTPNVPPYTPPGIIHTSDTFSNKLNFHLQGDFSDPVPAGGPYYITTEITMGSTVKTMTYELYKWPVNVTTVNKTDNNVSIYPNPAKDELNVVFDANAGVKTIAIRNIIGKVVGMYKVNGNSAKLNVSNLQSGIYFINLTDGQGHIVAIRKFTTN